MLWSALFKQGQTLPLTFQSELNANKLLLSVIHSIVSHLHPFDPLPLSIIRWLLCLELQQTLQLWWLWTSKKRDLRQLFHLEVEGRILIVHTLDVSYALHWEVSWISHPVKRAYPLSRNIVLRHSSLYAHRNLSGDWRESVVIGVKLLFEVSNFWQSRNCLRLFSNSRSSLVSILLISSSLRNITVVLTSERVLLSIG